MTSWPRPTSCHLRHYRSWRGFVSVICETPSVSLLSRWLDLAHLVSRFPLPLLLPFSPLHLPCLDSHPMPYAHHLFPSSYSSVPFPSPSSELPSPLPPLLLPFHPLPIPFSCPSIPPSPSALPSPSPALPPPPLPFHPSSSPSWCGRARCYVKGSVSFSGYNDLPSPSVGWRGPRRRIILQNFSPPMSFFFFFWTALGRQDLWRLMIVIFRATRELELNK